MKKGHGTTGTSALSCSVKKSDHELSVLLRRSMRAIQVRRSRILQEGRPWLKNRKPVAKSTPINTEIREQEERKAARNGYEKFYRNVFNPKHVPKADSYDNTALPVDYMETVLYIIKESGFKDRWAYILMHHYGIGDCKEPETYEAIAGYLDMSIGRVAQIKACAMELCRMAPRKEILQMGITEYNKNHKGRKKDDD